MSEQQILQEQFDLPLAELVDKEVWDAGAPLRDDPEFREHFYGEMAVVRTELRPGNPVSGLEVFYKDERVQPTGAYESRGASLARMLCEGKPVDVADVEPLGESEVVAGLCTLGEELVDDLVARGLADKNVVIPVPVADGGLICGFAIPVHRAIQEGRLGPGVQVIGVQPEGADYDVAAVGKEALRPITMAIVADESYVTGMYTFSELEIARAMDELEAELCGTVEPAAALPRAFLKRYADHYAALPEEERPVFVLPISGGNKSPETAKRYRSLERAAAQATFRNVSDAAARREEWGVAELDTRTSFHTDTTSRPSLSGFTARHRTGLVEPIRPSGWVPLDPDLETRTRFMRRQLLATSGMVLVDPL